MELSREQVAAFARTGYCLLPAVLEDAESAALRDALPELFAKEHPARVLEKDGVTVRSIYGTHMHDERFSRLVRNPVLVRAARALLGGDVYVYQFKVNAKLSFGGDVWEWHQDYTFWQNEDGLPRADALSIAVFLDDVNEFNGPIMVVPGTHAAGTLDSANEANVHADRRQPYQGLPSWINDTTAKLRYTINRELLQALVAKHGLEAPKGPRGAALVFHSNMVHGSAPNISPFERRIALVTYARVDNVPNPTGPRRPAFLCPTDCSPLKALDEA